MMLPMYLQPCKVQTCESLIGRKGGKGLCNAHYKRMQRGVPLEPPVQRRGEGWVSTHGYLYKGKRAEHRQIIEKKLGRKLDYNEVVHHKDGDPLNNSPDNLEVMYRGDHGKHHYEVNNGLAGKP